MRSSLALFVGFLSLVTACGSDGTTEEPGGSPAGQGGTKGGAAGSSGGSGGTAGQGGSASGASGKGPGGAGSGGNGAGQGGAGSSGKGGAGAGGAGQAGAGPGGAGSGGAGSGGAGSGGAGQGGAGQGGAGSGGAGSGGAGAAGAGQAGEGGEGGAGAGGAGEGGAGEGGAGAGGAEGGAAGSSAGAGGCSTQCGGECVDLFNDSKNCGACDNPCQPNSSCSSAACVCDAGFKACGNACVDTQTDGANCGSCGNACQQGKVCEAGACVCPVGLTACAGGCFDLNTNAIHCGGCGKFCANGASCEAGACKCPGEQIDCNGTCRDIKSNTSHCGACGNKCFDTYACQGGSCVCPAGFSECNLQCVDLQNDRFNCGTCTTLCAVGGLCEGGACKCPAGTDECVPGQCIDILADGVNCGGCNVVCGPGATCEAGACTCAPGSTYCDGFCVEAADCSFFVSQLLPDVGWQSGGNYLTIKGGGFAKGVKVFIGTGRAPAWVVDDKTLRIQTPPGPVGLHDVRVELGGSSFTKKNGFQYESGGLKPAWEQKKMQVIRGEDPGVAVLQDGRAIIAGGTKVPDSTAQALNTADLYSRVTDAVTGSKNTMGTPRWQNSAVTLLDGRALVVGGACYSNLTNCNGDPRKADLFDPATDNFTPTGDLNLGRSYTRAVLLPDGRVLVTSGNSPTLEVYDPQTGVFTLINHNVLHLFGFMVRLRDGRVLLGAGDGGNKAAEIFDPDTNTLAPTGNLVAGRSKLTAHTLPDGRVIVIGGASSSAGGINAPMNSMETYDPATGTFTAQPYTLQKGRCWHSSSLVRDGSILVMGGYVTTGSCASLDDTVDQVNPVTGVSVPAPFVNQLGQARLPNKNCEWSATTLLDGSVLAVGGGACGTNQALPDIDFLAGSD